MQSVRAFVGHSFTEGDQNVVGAFLGYLTSLKHIIPGFHWDHATRAEPNLVDAKVLDLFEGKNTLIAICTKKELVVDPAQLSQPFWSSSHRLCKADALVWKTSDWVLQEIGLAIGRGLKIVLLLEAGVRVPGSLQGNLEYISFQRDAPEKAFERLASMLASAAQVGAGVSGAEEVDERASQPVENNLPTPVSPVDPDATWTLEQFESGLLADSESHRKKIKAAFALSEHAQDTAKRSHFNAWAEYVYLLLGWGGDIEKLEALAKSADKDDQGAEIVGFLARSYMNLGELSKAAGLFELGAEYAVSSAKRVEMRSTATVTYLRAGDLSSFRAQMKALSGLAADNSLDAINLLSCYAKVAEIQQESNVQIAALEAQLELEPGNSELRFNLAYKYSELGDHELAYFHYHNIPRDLRTQLAWNNLGVALEKLNVNARAVEVYRKASTMGETLASANIGARLIDAGFLDQAKEVLIAATKSTDYHKNVDKHLARLKDIPEEEAKRLEEIEQKARPVSRYYRAFGARLLKTIFPPIGKKWSSPVCELDLVIEGERFMAKGSYTPKFGLMTALGSKTSDEPIRYVEYSGRLQGWAIVGEVNRWSVGATKLGSLLGDESRPKFLAWLSDDCAQVHVMEYSSSSITPNFYSFTEISGKSPNNLS